MTTHAPPSTSGLDALRHRLSTTTHRRPGASPAEAPAADEETIPDEPARCHGYWSGPDPERTQHAPCLNPAEWAGLSDHNHAKTTLRCTAHRTLIDIAVREDSMFCLTCAGPIHVMTWQPA